MHGAGEHLSVCSFCITCELRCPSLPAAFAADPLPSKNTCVMQAALARGALLTSDVRLWLKLASMPLVGSLCKLWPAFRSRMLGNPRFLMVLAIEEAIGVAGKWSAEKNSRKDKFWKVCCAGLGPWLTCKHLTCPRSLGHI